MGSLMGLQIHTRELDAVTTVIEFHGEMDIASTVKAKEAMRQLLENGCMRLIVNLRHTEYIDSTGLGALVGTLRRVREQGGKMRLVGLSGRVRRLFEITRLTMAFPIDANETEALQQMSDNQVSV